MKKTIALILTIVLTVCSLPVTALATGEPLYSDVYEGDWYYDAVKYAYYTGMMSGTGSGFSPNDTMTRGMLVTILYRLEGEPSVSIQFFPDVNQSAYYAKAISWANGTGILTGAFGKMMPDNPVTREQFATILYRYADYIGVDTRINGSVQSFPDSGSVGSYARDAMNWAVGMGLINGSDGKLNPNGASTRAMAATILMRFRQNLLKLPDPTYPRLDNIQQTIEDIAKGRALKMEDGDYTVRLHKNMIYRRSVGVFAEADVVKEVTFSDAQVQSLRVGDYLHVTDMWQGLGRYSDVDILVEKLERYGNSIYIASDELAGEPYYLNWYDGVWTLHGYDDMPEYCFDHQQLILFPKNVVIDNQLGRDGYEDRAHSTLYGLDSLLSLSYFYDDDMIGITMKNGVVSDAIYFYVP